jgi:hypothetical protein
MSPGKRKKVRPYLENTQHKKRTGGVAQVVEHLPGKHAVKFKPQDCQKKKKKKKTTKKCYHVDL